MTYLYITENRTSVASSTWKNTNCSHNGHHIELVELKYLILLQWQPNMWILRYISLSLYMCMWKCVGGPQSQYCGLVFNDLWNIWNIGFVIKKLNRKYICVSVKMMSLGHLFAIITLDGAAHVLGKLPEWKML